ncbi:thioredoxin TrxA [Buchnera aphidicola (Mollitrichosiphum nigrofasciatum)]|uniref:thioredoxin TrxA n=1 Tax=Buchnera aphidicola TaxID=9 RepID=UPI0031B89130
MNNSKIINLTDDNFNEKVLQEKKMILVDFWAEWCAPCKLLQPILEEIAEEFYKKIKIAKINIDLHPLTAPKYSIRGIPTLLLFKNGELLSTKVGALSKNQLIDFLQNNLK